MPDIPELTGLFPSGMVRTRTIERPPASVVARFLALGDLTGTVCDAMDAAGLTGAVAAATLAPLQTGIRIVGPAITVRTERRQALEVPGSRMGDVEAHNLAAAGDVLVVQGAAGISSLGGISARIGRRQGELGAVVDGSVRDVASLRELAFPIWSRGPSPLTGKHRLRTVEIMGPVVIAGSTVHPGDLVVADDSGICFVPRKRISEVLALAEALAAKEARRVSRIDGGVSVADLARE